MKKNIISGKSGALALALVVASLIGLTLPAVAAPPSGSRQYSASMTPANALGGVPTVFTVTITNQPASSAVLGSANLTLPTGFTAVGSPTIIFSSGKVWTASKTVTTPITIRLRAVGDTQKLSPGQSVTVQFTATLPCSNSLTTYFVLTAAKASRDFTGSSSFTRVGPNPSVVVSDCGGTVTDCPDEPVECTGTAGDPDNAPASTQTGEVTILGNGCGGCTLTVTQTVGDFCADSESTPPQDCRSPIVVKFTFSSAYDGSARVTLTCDASDCPLQSPSSDFYPVYFTDSDGPTTSGDNVLVIDTFCSSEGFTSATFNAGCIISKTRLGNGDYQSVISLFFQNSVDPRTGY